LDVLAIDELDKVGQTDWARERIHQLLDARYQRAIRQETLTVIAANLNSLDELSGYLKSRIEDNRFTVNGYVVRLQGTDGRKSMPKNWKY
jgi:DNA replication protein DnaC